MKTKLIISLSIIIMLPIILGVSLVPSEEGEIEQIKGGHVEYSSNSVDANSTDEQKMWDYLMNQYENPVAAAAVLGNAIGESSLVPYRLSNDIDRDMNGEYPFSKEYAQAVDSGEITRDEFIFGAKAPVGYDSFGLFNWYGESRKKALYDYAVSRQTSIFDWEMQLDFAYSEIIERYYDLYEILMTETDLKTATDAFTMIFERASNEDIYTNKRLWYAQEIFEKYWGTDSVELKYHKGEILPVNQDYEYMNTEIVYYKNDKTSNIYAYMIQTGLINLGYSIGSPDGYYQTQTEKTVKIFQKDNNLPETGIFTPADWAVLAELNGIER